jgi:hypothetical protein
MLKSSNDGMICVACLELVKDNDHFLVVSPQQMMVFWEDTPELFHVGHHYLISYFITVR